MHGTTYSVATPIVLAFGGITIGYSRCGVRPRIWEKALWSAADRIAAVSTSVKSDLNVRYGISDDKIRLVYNGVDSELFRPIENPEFPEKSHSRGKEGRAVRGALRPEEEFIPT